MILKSLSRKSGTRQLLKYLFEKKEKLVGDKQKPILIRHNVRSRTLDKWVKEFNHNESFRLRVRKDNVKVFHTILSLSHKDREHINEKLLRSIAKQYMKLRGENNLYIGTAHYDKAHIHLHLVHSGTKYLTGESNRLSRQEFHNLKLGMDAYQRERFPELINSLPRHGKSKEVKVQKELPLRWRSSRESHKDILLKTLESVYTKSRSLNDFISQIKLNGHEVYYRNGRLQGIKFDGNLKFRLSRLGYDKEKIALLNAIPLKEEKDLEELRELREQRSLDRAQSTERGSLRDEISDDKEEREQEEDIERELEDEDSEAEDDNRNEPTEDTKDETEGDDNDDME